MSGITDGGNAKAAAFAQAVKATQDTFNPAARERIGDRKNNQNSTFPVTLGSADPEDDRYKRRAALIDSKSGLVPGVGMPLAPEGYFDYAKRKADENLYTNFLEWIFKNADLSTPESAAYWTEKFPFIKEKMFAEIEREAELQQRLAKINAVGPQDEQDWFTLWCISQGMIKPFDSPLYKMNTAALPYQGGLFSIFNLGPVKVKDGLVNYNKSPTDPTNWTATGAYGISTGYPAGTGTPPTLAQTKTYYDSFQTFTPATGPAPGAPGV